MANENKRVEAEWTGCYPRLCSGNWILKVGGVNVSDKIPEDLQRSPMNTYGTYTSQHFNEEWLEVFENYTDGLHEKEWLKEKKSWLDTITTDSDVQKEIFFAIQEQNFRIGSCGGCIKKQR